MRSASDLAHEGAERFRGLEPAVRNAIEVVFTSIIERARADVDGFASRHAFDIADELEAAARKIRATLEDPTDD